MTDMRHLWRRGNQYYLKVHIPRPLQKHFPTSTGKTKSHIIEALGDSLSQAQLKRNRRVAATMEVFARLRAGEQMTPEQIKVALNLDLKGIAEQSYAETLQIMPTWFRRLAEKYQLSPDDELYQMRVEQICKQHGMAVPPLNSDAYKEIVAHIVQGQRGAEAAIQAKVSEAAHPAIEQPTAETISQAAEAWFTELQRAGRRQNTIIGHRQHVQAFVKRCGDRPLTEIPRAMASDFLDNLAAGGLVNRTVNQYNVTLFCVFKSAKKRGRFTGENPFEDQHREVNEETNRPPFEDSELQTLFDALPREVTPARYSPKTALPWVSLIGAFSGMRIEEISQLKAEDIKIESTNGGTTTVIDIHNGPGYSLKTKSTPRLVPVHSALVHAGLLDYVAALPKGSMLFPGLTRSKDGKIGKQVGDLFKRKLKALGLKRKGLCFHSLRHTVGDRLRKAGIPEDDRAALLGHKNKHITSRVYGHGGPGLKRLAGMVEALQYEGLKI